MALYTVVLTVDLEDDSEAAAFHHDVAGLYAPAYAEVIETRWFHDLDAEGRAALVGVEWG